MRRYIVGRGKLGRSESPEFLCLEAIRPYILLRFFSFSSHLTRGSGLRSESGLTYFLSIYSREIPPLQDLWAYSTGIKLPLTTSLHQNITRSVLLLFSSRYKSDSLLTTINGFVLVCCFQQATLKTS